MNDLAASVRARLLNLAKSQRVDFNEILVRFALERMLYRLSQSPHASRFVLKGALLFNVWYDLPHRATRDADLLGFGASDQTSLERAFREIAAIPCDDGIQFDPQSVRTEGILKDAGYAGARVLIQGTLSQARCKTQIDVGFGDAVTPPPQLTEYPVLLSDLPMPRLHTYPVYAVIAEKLHAIVKLGMTNTRLKDYFDLFVILNREVLNPELLARAIRATFDRRSLPLPSSTPLGLTSEFAMDGSRQAMWTSFIKKNGLTSESLPAANGSTERTPRSLTTVLPTGDAPRHQAPQLATSCSVLFRGFNCPAMPCTVCPAPSLS